MTYDPHYGGDFCAAWICYGHLYSNERSTWYAYYAPPRSQTAYKHFEAPTMEEAIRLCEQDQGASKVQAGEAAPEGSK